MLRQPSSLLQAWAARRVPGPRCGSPPASSKHGSAGWEQAPCLLFCLGGLTWQATWTLVSGVSPGGAATQDALRRGERQGPAGPHLHHHCPRCSLPPEEGTPPGRQGKEAPGPPSSQCPWPPGLQQRLAHRSHPDLQTPAQEERQPHCAPGPCSPLSSSFTRHTVPKADRSHSTKTLRLRCRRPFRVRPEQCWGSF